MRLLGLAYAVAAALCAVAATGAAAQAATSTRTTIDDLLVAGAIDQPTHDRAYAAYDSAVKALGALGGARFRELKAVIGEVDGIAGRGSLTAGTLAAVTVTLERNRQWWTTRPLLGVGGRVRFENSQLVWQHYRRKGLQIQWLATFGKANSLWRLGRTAELRALLDESLGLAAPRAQGIAWEYLFAFDGGKPPWVSGLAQGTALSALSRATSALGDPKYLEAARSALGIFRTAPPEGVHVPTPVGAHYLQYSFAPSLRILNGFVQSLNGLADFTVAAGGDPEGQALLAAGDGEALAELPAYDTGGWSRYSNRGRDSDLNYHKVLRDFLQGRCDRGGDAAFCAFSAKLTTQLSTPPLPRIVPARPPRQTRTGSMRFVLDKPARATLRITGKGYRKTVVAPFSSGAHRIAWRPPRAGLYAVTLDAVDLAGNRGSAAAPVRVAR